MTTLANHPDKLPTFDWLVTWESPVGDQYATIELNNNPYYTVGSCTITTCRLPGMGRALSWDDKATTNALGWDAGDYAPMAGQVVLVEGEDGTAAATPFESMTIDVDPATGKHRFVPSVELAKALSSRSKELWPEGSPEMLVLNKDAIAKYWRDRDASLHFEAIHTSHEELMVMVLGSVEDHVQTQPDFPHLASTMLGWASVDHGFYRLNPDTEYLKFVDAGSMAIFPDNDANTWVPWPDTRTTMVPDSADSSLKAAAFVEMMDRTHYEDTSPNLAEVLHKE